MSASVTVSYPVTRNRSDETRRAARRRTFERERLVIADLNRGVSVREIAARLGVTEKRTRAIVREALAAHRPAPPEEFVALQISRLNEALLVAYSAMSGQNLAAVGHVVKILRELDRYHGFVPLPHAVGKMSGEARQMGYGKQGLNSEGEAGCFCNPASIEAAGHTPSVAFGDTFPGEAGEGAAAEAQCRDRPQTAPQAVEKPQSAPGIDAAPNASDEALASLAGPAEAPERARCAADRAPGNGAARA